MKKISVCVALLIPISPALAGSSLPREVQEFINRREGCNHMRGELPDPREKQWMKEVNLESEKLCKGTDKQLVQLKKKYASNVVAMQRLKEFEEGVEALKVSVSSPVPGR